MSSQLLTRYPFISLLLPLRVLSTLECELYIADSSIPNAGIGIFSGVAKSVNDTLGNGDKAIPLIEIHQHNGWLGSDDPTMNYVWDGTEMGMGLESTSSDIAAFWPGVDCMVNAYPGLFNVDAAFPTYNEDGVHRSKHPGAGAMSPYDAGESRIKRDIPIGGEIFKDYGEDWFLTRPFLGNIAVESSQNDLLDLMGSMANLTDENDGSGILPSILYNELIRKFKIIWDSRTLNAIYDFGWDEMRSAVDKDDMGYILQPSKTRSIEWLNENGKCIDHIVHGRSTIDGAGSGAFAKRDLPKDTIVTGTPLLVFPTGKWFNMYRSQTCPDGSIHRNTKDGPIGKQLLLNYCFGHPESTIHLCPYGSGINYINHNKTRANIRIQWAKNGITSHRDESLHRKPSNTTKVAFDYVTTRDIAEGEELFLDYGDAWEDEWNKRNQDWKLKSNFSFLNEYMSSKEFNRHHGKEPLLTTDEQLLEPYPDHLFTRCHGLVCDSGPRFTGNVSEISGLDGWSFQGCKCDILSRDDKNESYSVQVDWDSKGIETADNVDFTPGTVFKVSKVPREAISFADKPYTTDLHMTGVFRQPLGIPDEILPDTWRNVIDGENCSSDDPTCKAKEKTETTEDPCKISFESDSYIDYYDYEGGDAHDVDYVYDDNGFPYVEREYAGKRSKVRGVY